MNIYNSVLLNDEGIIQRVHTNFIPGCPVEKVMTLYTFSECMENSFLFSFLPCHLYTDNDGEHAVADLILAGTHFVKRNYTALVFANANEEEALAMLRQYPHWKAFAWSRAVLCNSSMIAVSIKNAGI